MSEKVCTELMSPWSLCGSTFEFLSFSCPWLSLFIPLSNVSLVRFFRDPRMLRSSRRSEGSGEICWPRIDVSSVCLLFKAMGRWLRWTREPLAGLCDISSFELCTMFVHCGSTSTSYSSFLKRAFMLENVSTMDELPILSGCGVSTCSVRLLATVF